MLDTKLTALHVDNGPVRGRSLSFLLKYNVQTEKCQSQVYSLANCHQLKIPV